MPQKPNLNINPYFDDFDKAINFYKMNRIKPLTKPKGIFLVTNPGK